MLKAIFVVRGHGKNSSGRDDNGVVFSGTTEWKEAGEVCKELMARLVKDEDLAVETIVDVGVMNRMTLQQKIKQVNDECESRRFSASEALLISVHFNAAKNKSARGVEAWYGTRKRGGRDFARKITENVSGATGLPIRKYPTQPSSVNRHGRLAIVDDTTPLAVLVECGFLTNELDAKFIKDSKMDDSFALGIHMAIRDHMNLSYQIPILALPEWFKDVPEREWYYDAVKFCLNEGLVKMNKEGLYHPDQAVNRAEMAQILYRLLTKLRNE